MKSKKKFVTKFGVRCFQAGHFSFHRPVLVILDRLIDMATPLHHTWTYQALAHDLLQYSLNRYGTVQKLRNL